MSLSMSLSSRSDAVPLEPSELKDILGELRIEHYFQAATASFLVYDTIITLDKEAKYFWKLPRRPVDFIYFINRYIGIFGTVAFLPVGSLTATLPLCGFSQWTRNIANWVTIISVDYILMLRVLALYSQDKTLSVFLKTLLVLEAVFKLGMVISLDILEHAVTGSFASISVCGENSFGSWWLGLVDWSVPLIYGTLLMILALYKAAEYWRVSSGFKGFTLVKVLIEDQIVYFLLAISCSVFAMLGFRLQTSDIFLSEVLNQLGNPAVLSPLGSRMLFNLKEAGERGQNEGTSYRTPSGTMSDMDFAEPGKWNGTQWKFSNRIIPPCRAHCAQCYHSTRVDWDWFLFSIVMIDVFTLLGSIYFARVPGAIV